MPTIRASEVAEYSFCARAWWLRRVAGEQPEGAARRATGVRLHARHGRAVAASRLLLWAGLLTLAGGLLLLIL